MFNKEDTVYIEVDDSIEEAIVKGHYKSGKYKVLVEMRVNPNGEMLIEESKVYCSRIEYYDKKIEEINRRLEVY